MIVTIKLLKPWMNLKAGSTTEVGKAIADQMVADGWAVIVAPKTGAKPSRTKVAKAESVKG